MTIFNFEKCKSEDRANCFADGCPYAGAGDCARFEKLLDFKFENKKKRVKKMSLNKRKKLFLIQGTNDFTNMTNLFSQKDLERMKWDGMDEKDLKKVADDLGISPTDFDQSKNTFFKQLADSCHIGTQYYLVNKENFSPSLFKEVQVKERKIKRTKKKIRKKKNKK